ncbi:MULTISPECIES: hypothetical protein [unclassified Cryobacterium]|uniref:hypothetical protein n=1 Tax=unclassified Cryobacterium TaxID=2649013 RepID=UPI0018E0C23D|nr:MULTISPECIES: hypothetical protein [unclassified Cryobacterium]
MHGANLGVRADRYLAAGEFPGIDADEDIALVAALRRLRVCEIRTARIPVRTSGRLVGRTPGGFAGYLRAQTARLPVIMETGVLQVDDAGALP